jgi:hypothetical protein
MPAYACPNCQRLCRATDRQIGNPVHCPKCRAMFRPVLVGPSESPADAAAFEPEPEPMPIQRPPHSVRRSFTSPCDYLTQDDPLFPVVSVAKTIGLIAGLVVLTLAAIGLGILFVRKPVAKPAEGLQPVSALPAGGSPATVPAPAVAPKQTLARVPEPPPDRSPVVRKTEDGRPLWECYLWDAYVRKI